MNKSEDTDIRLNKSTTTGGDRVNTNQAAIQLTPNTIKMIRDTLAEGIARKIALAIINSANQANTYEK